MMLPAHCLPNTPALNILNGAGKLGRPHLYKQRYSLVKCDSAKVRQKFSQRFVKGFVMQSIDEMNGIDPKVSDLEMHRQPG